MTAFQPDEFVAIGRDLIDDDNYNHFNEARYRTIISRSYYGIFLTLRDLFDEGIKNLLPSDKYDLFNQISESGVMHGLVGKILKSLDYHAGSKFHRLKYFRECADYHTFYNIDKEWADDCIGIATDIDNKVKYNISPNIIQIIDEAKIRKIIEQEYEK